MNVGSLFSGIGGFDRGLERAGMRTVWFCEQDEFCQRVLAKHWPDVPCYADVRELAAARVVPVDVICGGFPCQDISIAGKGAGLAGARSGLWSEYARLVGELRPRYVVVENVPALLVRGLDVVLGDLAALGYDAEWDCIPARAVGAPHLRDRIWLVAYPSSDGRDCGERGAIGHEGSTRTRLGDAGEQRCVDDDGPRRSGPVALVDARAVRDEPEDVADTHQTGRLQQRRPVSVPAQQPALECGSWWAAEPDVGRMAHGIPDRVDRVQSLGNALVPQIAQWIGERIMSYEASK